MEFEADRAEFAAKDFRGILDGAADKVLLRIEADDAAGARAAGAAGALAGAGLTDAGDGEFGKAGVDGIAGDAGEAGIDDHGDAADGERAFGNVGGEDHFAPRRGKNGTVLFFGREIAIEG